MLSIHLRSNRLLAGRLVDGARKGLAALVGPRRPGLKLAAAGLAAVVFYLAVAQGEHRISARAVLEPEIQRAATAPFDGFVASAPVRAGDRVESGQTLVTLDDRDLLIDRAKWIAERNKLAQRQREALAKYERSALAVLEPQLQQALSQLALVEERLARIRILAPFDGIVVSGDLSQMIGSPVEKGKTLFEIAPLNAYRLMVHVDERDISFVSPGQTGMVALAGMPATALPLQLTRVTPVTVAEDGRNTFRAEARLVALDSRLRPGLEGVAKLDAGRRALLWIWTRPLVDWVRLAVWRYLP
jgi:multidrug resistance efflux pump